MPPHWVKLFRLQKKFHMKANQLSTNDKVRSKKKQKTKKQNKTKQKTKQKNNKTQFLSVQMHALTAMVNLCLTPTDEWRQSRQ